MRQAYVINAALLAAVGFWIFLKKSPDISGRQRNVLKQMFRSDYSSYQFRDTPVGNFGAGTVYDVTFDTETNHLCVVV